MPRLAVSRNLVYRLFYPQVPMIVAAKYGENIAAMPANSCMPVSNDPPLLAVSVRIGSKTNKVLRRAKNFSVNWLNYVDHRAVTILGSTVDDPDKLAATNILYDIILNTPVLVRGVAYAVCEKESIVEAGDHQIFIGSVLGAMASLDFDENWKFEDYRPILYLGSEFKNSYATLGAHCRKKLSSSIKI